MGSLHQDRVGLAAPVQGTLFEGTAGRLHDASHPLQYADGPEFRDDEELARIASQLPGKPITLGHPNGLVRDGAPANIIGTVVSARIVEDHVVVGMMIFGEDGLAAIAEGVGETSLGYTCSLDEARYQRGISIDHLAVVPRGRCITCVLRADCGCSSTEIRREPTVDQRCVCKDLANGHGVQNNPLDMAITTSPDDVAADKARADLAETNLATATARADKAEQDLSAATARADKAEQDLAAEKARADAAEKARETFEGAALDAKAALTPSAARADKAEQDFASLKLQAAADLTAEKVRSDAAIEAVKSSIPELVNAKVALIAEVAPVLQSTAAELAKMSDRDIKIAVIKRVDGFEIDKAKSDDFVEGRFLGSMTRANVAAESRADARVAIQAAREDAAVSHTKPNGLTAEKQAAAEEAERQANAWKTKKDQE